MANGYVREEFETSAIGSESVTPTTSTKKIYPVLTEFTMDPGTQHLDRSDELRGSEEVLALVPERYEPAWSATYRAYPDVTAFKLKHILGVPVTTAGNGVITDPDGATVPTGAYRHVWTSTSSDWGTAGVSPLTETITVAYKDQSVFGKFRGAACDTFSFATPERGGAQISAGGPAAFLDDGIADPALTATYESSATKPFTRGGVTIGSWLSGTGAKDDLSFAINAPADRVFSMGSGSKWADTVEKGEGLITVTGSVTLHQADAQDIAALRAATGFAVKAKWASETVIASSYTHKMWLEGVNAQYVSGGPGALANTRRIPASFDFQMTTAGSGVQTTITVINSVSSYA